MSEPIYLKNFDEIQEARKRLLEIESELDAWADVYIEQKIQNISGSSLDDKLGQILDNAEIDLTNGNYEVGSKGEGIFVAKIISDKPYMVEDFARESGIEGYSADTHDLEALYHRGNEVNYNEIRLVDIVNKSSMTYSVSEKISEKLNQMLIDKLVDKSMVLSDEDKEKINMVTGRLVDELIPLSEDLGSALKESNLAKSNLAMLMAEQASRLKALEEYEQEARAYSGGIRWKFIKAVDDITEKISSAIEKVPKPDVNKILSSVKAALGRDESLIKEASEDINKMRGMLDEALARTMSKIMEENAVDKLIGDRGVEKVAEAAQTKVFYKHLEALTNSLPFEKDLQLADTRSGGFIKDTLSKISSALTKADVSYTKFEDKLKTGLAAKTVNAIAFLAEKREGNGMLSKLNDMVRGSLSKAAEYISITIENPAASKAIKNAMDKAEQIAAIKSDVSSLKAVINKNAEFADIYHIKAERAGVKAAELEKKIHNLGLRSNELSSRKEQFQTEIEDLKNEHLEATKSGLDTGIAEESQEAIVYANEIATMINEKQDKLSAINEKLAAIDSKLSVMNDMKTKLEATETKYAKLANLQEKYIDSKSHDSNSAAVYKLEGDVEEHIAEAYEAIEL